MSEIKLSENNLESGLTYSTSTYNKFGETGNKNLFEEIIDSLMLTKYSDDQELINYIKTLPKDKKRIAILSLLDGDNNLWTKINEHIESSDNKLENIKDVVLMLRKFVKVGEVEKKKYGEVMTPLELVKDMLKTLPQDVWSNPNLKWLDPANGTGPFPIMVIYKLMNGLKDWEPDEEKRYKHIVENMIYTCELQDKNVFLWLCAVDPKDEYTTNTYWGSFLEEGFDKHMKEVWNVNNFDIVLGNPPFNQMIDLKFLQKSYEISDKILFVHPSTWLLDEKNKQKKFIKAKELVKDDLKSITLFNGNGVFNINLFVPCSITYIDKSNKYDNIIVVDKVNGKTASFNSINNINKYASDIYVKIKNKIKPISEIDNVWLHKYENGVYYANIAQHRGNHTKDGVKIYKDDFYTIFTKTDKPTIEATKHLWYGFKTEDECYNFIEYLKTKTTRFILSIYKNNSQVCRGELEIIPWLDFTQEWTDEKLKKHFKITDKEWEFIESVIPDYY